MTGFIHTKMYVRRRKHRPTLRADKVKPVEMADVDPNHGMTEKTVIFTHKQKQRSDGFMYNKPSTFFSMSTRYMGQIYMNMVRSG